MGDLISREALKNEFKARCICNCDRCKYQKGAYCGLIDNAPTVSDRYDEGYTQGTCDCEHAHKRPQGEWVKEDDEHLKGWYRCSECGRRVEDLTDDVVIHAGCEDYTIADIYPYCHCGAKMQKGGAEE